MDILLILNKGQTQDYKIIVHIEAGVVINRLNHLLRENKQKEAFNLAFSKAQVKEYIPAGCKSRNKPALTLVEDLLF